VCVLIIWLFIEGFFVYEGIRFYVSICSWCVGGVLWLSCGGCSGFWF